MGWDFWNDPDWVSTNETDGDKFYGYDDGEDSGSSSSGGGAGPGQGTGGSE